MSNDKNNQSNSLIIKANRELNEQLADASVMRALTATVFKGFKNENLIKQACLEAMMRGYTFQDILNKKIYAIPFGNSYSLVQSIADVRATAMRSGQIGKSAPEFEEKDGRIISCTVTVRRLISGQVGDYTATVYFNEYNKGKDNWVKKPRTMIAKVAEMHALRMAFPEELSLAYVEEEFEKDKKLDLPTPEKFKKEDETSHNSSQEPEESQEGETVKEEKNEAENVNLDDVRNQINK